MRLQAVWWWPPSDWSFGYWRWPEWIGEREMPKDFGFHGFCLGPIEFRYWLRNPASARRET